MHVPRALVQESIFDKFLEKAVARVAKIKPGDPLDPTTMMGAQASHGQLEKILNYISASLAASSRRARSSRKAAAFRQRARMSAMSITLRR